MAIEKTNKGLQKFTDFELIKTKEQFTELQNTGEARFQELICANLCNLC